MVKNIKFLLTRLLRGVTNGISPSLHHKKFLLTRLLRGVTRQYMADQDVIAISTHTPLARRDRRRLYRVKSLGDFYSHASCEA